MQAIRELITKELTVIIMACLPIVEVRGAIPVGIHLGMNPIHAATLGVIGGMIPVPFILFGTRPLFNYLRSTKDFKNIVNKLTTKSIDNHGYKLQKWGARALILLVAIPLPGTGVWSASLAAALLDIRFKWAFPAIFIGNIFAAVIILLLNYGIKSIF